jgi:ectoine hydroxylase-related dioxygenase (phytanoyl-CoA dioxygenase family)
MDNLLSKNEVDLVLSYWDKGDFVFIKQFFLNNQNITSKIHEILPEEYVLIDYTYVIENSSIHTFHRDYTSSKNYNNLKYSSYTMILYLDDSDTGLNIIPGSHKDNSCIYFYNRAKKLHFIPGTAVIFDADILHAGSIVDSEVKRRCIQFKIIHRDDRGKLLSLQNYHVLINRPNNKFILLKEIESILTRHFPIFMDIFQGHIKTSFSEDKTMIQNIVSKIIFSDTDFYKPKRI